jgi:hypothetical protein
VFRPIDAVAILRERRRSLGRQHDGQGRHHQSLHRAFKSDLAAYAGPVVPSAGRMRTRRVNRG